MDETIIHRGCKAARVKIWTLSLTSALHDRGNHMIVIIKDSLSSLATNYNLYLCWLVHRHLCFSKQSYRQIYHAFPVFELCWLFCYKTKKTKNEDFDSGLQPSKVMVLIIIPTITIKIRTGIRMTVCDNSRTYVPEVRQYYCLVLLCFQSRKYHVGTRNPCYLRTYILQVPHDLSKHLESTVNL